ncbi:hypothetical protein PENSUB_1092 [Penicillium subrubescens]|uniref:Uncharacterized protein n=1 Tax=Penicillium subrubescens TaxID=1316194 RepID=A0A1Q5UKK0_9EURO|nr:hypothetical protein PENSUB_1092 [Penicillium subrubescens]
MLRYDPQSEATLSPIVLLVTHATSSSSTPASEDDPKADLIREAIAQKQNGQYPPMPTFSATIPLGADNLADCVTHDPIKARAKPKRQSSCDSKEAPYGRTCKDNIKIAILAVADIIRDAYETSK